MKKYINKSRDGSGNDRLPLAAKLMFMLLAFIIVNMCMVPVYGQTIMTQKGLTTNIGSGAYLTTGGDIIIDNGGAIDNSGTIKIGGEWTNDANGLINASPGKVEFNGTSSQAIGGTSVTDFNDVTVDNASGVSLGNDETVNGVLTFTNGKITTGANTLELGADATTSGAASGKYVYGTLEKHWDASGDYLLTIGDATTYAPVDVNISGVSASGSITATTVAGASPNENNPIANSSGINQSAKANRYWTLSNSGIAFTNYSADFNYDAGEATGNPLNYVVRKFGAAWSTTTLGSVTATSTQATGVTAFGEFEVGVVNAAPSLNCPADIYQCDNHVVTFSSPAVVGSPAVLSTCVPVSGSTFVTGTTAVNCSATNINGTGNCTFNVIIGISPTAAASVDQTICYTGSATLNGSFGGGASSAGWTSLGDGTFNNANLMNAIYTPGAADITNGTVTLVLTTNDPAGPCIAASDQIVLTILTSPPAQPGIVTGTTPACPGNTLTYFISPVAGAISYTWTSLDGNASITGGQGTVSANILFGILPTGQSTYPMSVVATNACGNSVAKTFSPRGKISQPTFTPGLPGVVCQNTNGVVYTVNPVAGAASYTWTITGSGAAIQGSNTGASITVNFATYTSVTISVTATNACMTTAARVMTVKAVPSTPGTIVGPSYVCPNGVYQYSVAAVPGALTYLWTGPAGSSVSGNANVVNITFGASIPGGSSVSVRAVGSCANNSALRSKGVASGMPNIPSAISGLGVGQCGETGVSYFINPNNTPPVTSYTWSVNNGATIFGPNNLSGVTVDFPPSFSSVLISVLATNSCGSSAARTLSVLGAPNSPTSISGSAVPCSTTVVQYCAVGSTNATSFVWTIPAGASILGSQTGSCIQVLWGSSGGSITCQAVNDCGTSSAKVLPISIPCRQAQVINSGNGLNAEVYPNPAVDKATLKFNSALSGKYHLGLTNMIAQNVMSLDGAATEGINMVDLDLSTVAKGVYLLNIVSGDNNEQIRLIVE